MNRIPINWFQTILTIDMFYPLEAVQGIRITLKKNPELFKIDKYTVIDYYSLLKNFTIKSIYMKQFVKANFFEKSVFIVAFPIIIVIDSILTTTQFVLLLLFRYSLKSTAWIYLPLIWLIQPQDRQNLTTRLKIESKNFIAYLMFFYSLIVVLVFTLLPLLFPDMYIEKFDTLPDTFKIIFFAYPSHFENWNWILYITRSLSALITIVFMVSFTKILIRRENGEPSYGDFWGAKLLSLRDIRSVLTLITLGFTAYHILGLLDDNFFGELWANRKVFPEE